mmetsp:Transcript_21474/g.44176  ORF Transcript_21474/g.44176 Transcript_21474/m.44176 type:complete len:196 (-) Transcript_21474:3431-4018(-)
MAEDPSSKLAAAAQELLQAAGVEVSSDAQKKISADLVSFKESADAKLNTVNQSIITSRTHADDKINTIDQRLSSLEQKVVLQTQEITKQTKLQNLSFALQNAKLNSFEYHVHAHNSYCRKDSSDLAQDIIFSFRQGYGHFLPNGCLNDCYGYDKAEWEKDKKDFREKLVNQIHGLTGTKPRVEKKEDARFVIYYS